MLVERLGLDYAGIKPEFIQDIVEQIVQGIAESRATKPSLESLYKNIYRNRNMFLKAIASKLVLEENLTLEQLEFILAYAPEIAGKMSPKLYKDALKLNADHIIDSLRTLWIRYGKPTPVECPYCGFRAVLPDLTCGVCGRIIDEKDLKSHIKFDELLKVFAESSPLIIVQEVLSSNIAIFDGHKILPPSQKPHGFYIEFYLSHREKELLEKIVKERRMKGGFF